MKMTDIRHRVRYRPCCPLSILHISTSANRVFSGPTCHTGPSIRHALVTPTYYLPQDTWNGGETDLLYCPHPLRRLVRDFDRWPRSIHLQSPGHIHPSPSHSTTGEHFDTLRRSISYLPLTQSYLPSVSITSWSSYLGPCRPGERMHYHVHCHPQ
jgi:hypothetical protein